MTGLTLDVVNAMPATATQEEMAATNKSRRVIICPFAPENEFSSSGQMFREQTGSSKYRNRQRTEY
jgi:hypothetical protein